MTLPYKVGVKITFSSNVLGDGSLKYVLRFIKTLLFTSETIFYLNPYLE